MDGDQPTFGAFRVQIVEETGSTNADLLVAAAAGAAHGTVLCARHQTAGRGRLDRRWDAPPGANLLVSVLLREGVEQPHRLTQRVGVAAVRACERVAGCTPELKWPNDLLLGDAKLGGILAEAGGQGGTVDHVVVGLGLNVRWAPPGAARLGEAYDPLAVLDALLAELAALPDDHDAEYRRRLGTLGRRVQVLRAHDTVTGTAVDVLGDGRLVVVDDAGTRHAIDTGDVVHLRALAH
jgi:BirA family biotin operon repressor/biotin-[acetyl-CoA-carboxylase] ligase